MIVTWLLVCALILLVVGVATDRWVLMGLSILTVFAAYLVAVLPVTGLAS